MHFVTSPKINRFLALYYTWLAAHFWE